MEQQNELYKSQVTAVEAELHALITAYSTVKQKNDTEKVTLMKTKEKESKGGLLFKKKNKGDHLPFLSDIWTFPLLTYDLIYLFIAKVQIMNKRIPYPQLIMP